MKEFFTVENQDGERIDRYLSEELEDRSRSYIQKLIKENHVTVNQKPVKANYRLSLGDRVEIDLPEAKEPDIKPEDIPLDILYEDKDIIIVNKPKQMVVHPAPGHYSQTLVNALMYTAALNCPALTAPCGRESYTGSIWTRRDRWWPAKMIWRIRVFPSS